MIRLVAYIVLIVACIWALAGCATMERHPHVTAFVVGSLAATAAAHGHGGRDSVPPMSTPPDVTTQPVNCTKVDCR